MLYIQNKDIDSSDLNGEKVMMNLNLGMYFGLNEVGSRIWEIIKDKKTQDEIVELLVEEYNVELDICKSEVQYFLDRLEENELITVC
ncbi:lasso peptide biosynthesis PqqD family chaperone [Clostridium chrysemydis]|uniref:lasso peptide biosynthesis PqqD family chaperone n=1 Tax=Clostridium chrysemydis TaxID=2665504 RepID=UPI001884073B|nr:lasso peptide biosynthesis PqqD family chaperone [Clostridium chrysemydis]